MSKDSPFVTLICHKDRLQRRLAFGVLALGCVISSAASSHPALEIWSGAGWQSSSDMVNWFPAYSPYPNPITAPDYSTTRGQLMWHWPNASAPDGASGDSHVWFRYIFDLLDSGDYSSYRAWIAADDWMQVKVNGVPVGTYDLVRNMRGNQAVPKLIAFDVKANGPNEILIEARDKQVYEWVFFDADVDPRQIPPLLGPNAVSIPEPSAFGLVAVALLAAFLNWRAPRPH